jgi:hypothetical protein
MPLVFIGTTISDLFLCGPVVGAGQQAHPVGLGAVGRPHLAAVDYPVAADPAGGRLDRGDVGTRSGLRDAKTGHVVAGDRGDEEFLPQLVAAVAGEGGRRHRDLHAGGHRDRAAVYPTQRVGADHGVGEVEARAAELDGLVDAEKTGIAHLLEQLMGRKLALFLPLVDMGIDLAIDQRLPGLAQRLMLGGELHLCVLAPGTSSPFKWGGVAVIRDGGVMGVEASLVTPPSA